ncbi:MAG: transposase [Solirubrobacteraceae bacterium]
MGQDFEVDDDGVPCLFRGTRPGGSSRRSTRRCATGVSQCFSALTASSCTPRSPSHQQRGALITAVEIGDASAHDGAHAKTLIDAQPEERRPERILGDCAYRDQQTREDMEQRGVTVLAHVPEGERREGRVGKREFQVDLQSGTVTCPAGHVVAIPQRARRGGERVVNFGVARCQDCPLRSRCAPRPGGRKLTIARREDLLQAGRAALQDAGQSEPD